MNTPTITRRHALIALGATAFATDSFAQSSWPDKPIKLIVPFPPGGPTDTASRITAQALGERLKQSVVVENRAGASGSIGQLAFKTLPADGYSLNMLGSPAMLAPHLYKSATYHPANDFAPVAMVYDLPIVIVVNPTVHPRITDWPGLVAEARAQGGKLNYTTSGPGSVGHLTMEMLKKQVGFDMQHVAYKGSAPAMNDLLGGQIGVMFSDLIAALAHIKTGKLRAIALGAPRRIEGLPDIKTIADQGLPGFSAEPFGALLAPKGTPTAVVERLNAEMKLILAEPDVQERLIKAGCYPRYMSVADTAARIRTDFDRYGKVVRDNRITAD